MAVSAKLNYLRISPRKVRLVANLIRGKSTEEAQVILNFTVKKAARPLLKLLNSAIANAKNNFQLEPSKLHVSKITVDEGPKYKRWRARARGMAGAIEKRTSHITLVLDEIGKPLKEVKKVKKVKKLPTLEPEKLEKVLEKRPEKRSEIKPKMRPKMRPREERAKPRIKKGIKRVFRRKAF